MSEREALIRGILANPDDDAPRLVFADWLADRDDSRGEMVRLSVEKARLPKGDARHSALQRRLNAWWGDRSPPEWHWELDESGWVEDQRGLLAYWEIPRSTPPSAESRARLAAAMAEGWFESAHLHEVDFPRTASLLADWPELAAVGGLHMEDAFGLTDTGLAALASFPNIVALGLQYSDVTDTGMGGLAGFGRLRELSVPHSTTNAGLAHLTGLPLRELSLEHCRRVNGEGLRHLTALTELTALDLTFTDNIVPGLPHLAALPSLEFLSLNGQQTLADSDLAVLGGFRTLRRLLLSNTFRVTGAGLASLPPGLRVLSLDSAPGLRVGSLQHIPRLEALEELNLSSNGWFDGEGLAHLAGMRALRVLNLGYCDGMTDSSISHLRTLPALEELRLNGSSWLTDAGMERLAELSGLRILDLAGCPGITDAGLLRLQSLTRLRQLTVNRFRGEGAPPPFSPEVVDRLREALPDCDIRA